MREHKDHSGLLYTAERGGRSKITSLLDFTRALSEWRGRVWPLLLVVLLVTLFIPYLRVDFPIFQQVRHPIARLLLSLFPDIGVSLLVFAAFRWPVWTLAFFFATAPLANGLVAWVTLGNPGLHKQAGIFWVEPLFLSIAIGLLLRRAVSPDTARPKRLEARLVFYSVVVLISVALALRSGPALWDRLSVAWLHIPGMDQLSPSHPLRAGLLILASVLWYRLAATQLKTSADIQLACRGWLIGGFLTGVYGIWTWVRHEGALKGGIESVFDDTNAYGSYLVVTLFIAWGGWLTERVPWARALSALTLVITLWMFPLAGSRIAIIAATACAAIAWTTLARSARTRWIRGSALAAISCLILVFALVRGKEVIQGAFHAFPSLKSWGIQRFAQAMDTEFVLNVWRGGRRPILVAGLRMAGEKPIFGQGPGTFYSKLGDYYRPGDGGYRPPHENAHNYFVQAAAETGLVGLAGFLWIVASNLIAGFTRVSEEERLRARLLTIGIVGYLMTAFTGHPLLLSEQAFLFWGSLGLLRACSQLARAPSVARPPTSSLSTPPAL